MRQRIRGPLSPHCCQDNLVRVDVSLGSGVGNFVDLETIVRNMENDASKLVRVAMHEAEAELSILLCTDAHITTLNDKWRHISTPTDVLSFPQDDDVVSQPGVLLYLLPRSAGGPQLTEFVSPMCRSLVILPSRLIRQHDRQRSVTIP